MVKKMFQNRSIGFYIGLVASVCLLVTSVAMVAVWGDRTCSLYALIIGVVGALSFAGTLLTDIKVFPLVSALLCILATSFELYAVIPTFMDILNKVNFYGGNHVAAIAFTIAFVGCSILNIVSCYMKQREDS